MDVEHQTIKIGWTRTENGWQTKKNKPEKRNQTLTKISLSDDENDDGNDYNNVAGKTDSMRRGLYKLVNWLNVRKSMCIIYLMNKIGVSTLIQSV